MQEILKSKAIELILLDLNLPDGCGMQAISSLRKQHGLNIGIVVISARDSREDKCQALQAGADGYMVKPLFLPELQAHINQLKLRLPVTTSWQFSQQQRALISPRGVVCKLSKNETLLLQILVKHPDGVGRDTLLCAIAPYLSQVADYRRLDTMISRLRSKVAQECQQTLPLDTIRNYGYQLQLTTLPDNLKLRA